MIEMLGNVRVSDLLDGRELEEDKPLTSVIFVLYLCINTIVIIIIQISNLTTDIIVIIA